MTRIARSCGIALLIGALAMTGAAPAGPDDDDPFADSNAATATVKAPASAAASDKTSALLRLETSLGPQTARRGQLVRLTIKGSLKEGYHIYPITYRTPTQDEVGLTRLTYEPNANLQPLWPLTESRAVLRNEEGEGLRWEHERPFTWSQDVLVLPTATPGPTTLRAKLAFQVCDVHRCVPGERILEFPVTVTPEPASALSPELEKRRAEKQPAAQILDAAPATGNTTSTAASGNSGLLAFVLQGALWGALSLITPCVFPMIPITVSLFLKQSEQEHHRPLAMASVYCGTIIVVLTISAVALLSFFTKVSTHYLTNFGLGALFVYFALSLFGMYEIELPSGLARFTSAQEGQGGLVGTMFMALTFTIISFACVAPFMGGFSGTAAQAGLSLSYRVFGGLAFATAFASPFFVLALFPILLKKLPRSGTWLNSVKVVMGFLELAAALKFFRTGELVLSDPPSIFTYDLVLSGWVALSLLCGLYLLNVFRLPHDTPIEHLGVPRFLMSAAFLTLALYLLPALFKSGDQSENQRPRGAAFAWLDSFLLHEQEDPTVSSAKAGDQGAHSGELAWLGSLQEGIDDATKTNGKLVFVDFTGKSCTNCSWNERNVFSRADIRELFTHYSLVQLYTDQVPRRLYPPEQAASWNAAGARQKADANRALENERFNTSQLPLYVILRPKSDGGYEEVARYDEGKINDLAAFTRFLQQPLASVEQRAQASAPE